MTAAQPAAASHALLETLIGKGVLRFGDFVLKSGRRSPYFFNLGAAADGDALIAVGDAYADAIAALPEAPDVLFGPAYKGISIAAAAAVCLARNHRINVGITYDRKEEKAHGEGGALVGAPLRERRVAIVDDVVTDGAAKREASRLIAAAGGTVVGAVLALDRQEPLDPDAADGETAVEALRRSLGVPVRCLAALDDVLRYLESAPRFAAEAARLRAARG